MTEKTTIACTLSGDELRARAGELLPGLARRASAIEVTDEGAHLHFESAPGLLADIARVIEAERHCCKFFGFAVSAEPNDGDVRLTISAPAEARELIRELLHFEL